MRKLVLAVLFFSIMARAQGKTEFGRLAGAEFRIDVPGTWNHGLFVYYHGYQAHEQGGTFDAGKPLDPVLATFTAAGYAVIQSGYSRGGWALEQAIPETEALRQYFIAHYGMPSTTYVGGHSMGGMLTVMTIEQSPGSYAGGLDLCGAVQDAPSLFSRAFDLRVIFDFYFPGVLPNPSRVPADFEPTEARAKLIETSLQSTPEAASVLSRISGVHEKDLAGVLLFATWTFKDIEQRAAGSPFDNHNTIYTGTPDDNALNDRVQRYTADPRSLSYLERYYTPTGSLSRPVLAIHTTYDQLVPPSVPSRYALLTRVASPGDRFVLQYVKRDGHCNISPEEVGRGFAELLRWTQTGEKPASPEPR
jgi:pimeloyl-ACP methyl ester carboxylesterase